MSSIDSVNDTLAPSKQITEIIREFKVPEADKGRYKVYICTPGRTQSFLTSPGDTIRKKEKGLVREPRGTRHITLYPDDFIHSEYIGDDNQLVIGQLPFTMDMPGFPIDAPSPMSMDTLRIEWRPLFGSITDGRSTFSPSRALVGLGARAR